MDVPIQFAIYNVVALVVAATVVSASFATIYVPVVPGTLPRPARLLGALVLAARDSERKPTTTIDRAMLAGIAVVLIGIAELPAVLTLVPWYEPPVGLTEQLMSIAQLTLLAVSSAYLRRTYRRAGSEPGIQKAQTR